MDYEDSWTVTGDGKPFKISTDKKECELFVEIQLCKKKGGGLKLKPSVDAKDSANAAFMKWAVRPTQKGDVVV